jgi:tetratricopeptide (TPR) repeat protein
MIEPGTDSIVTRAEAARAEGRWSDAGDLYRSAWEAADAIQNREEARRLSTLAGDAYRRADRPAAAARCLQAALDLADHTSDPGRVVGQVQLAGVLTDAGQLAAALEIAQAAVSGAPAGPNRAVALDTLMSVRLALGDVAPLQGLLSRLDDSAPASMRCAISFRRAQVYRLQGHLEAAESELADAHQQLTAIPRALGALAATTSLQAEIRLLHDDGEGAIALFENAGRMWTTAQRRAGLYRSESGLIRANLACGRTRLPSSLTGPIEFARERGLPLLEAELRSTRATAWSRAHVSGAPEEYAAAIGLAAQAGARLMEGRIRLRRRWAGIQMQDAMWTQACLAGDVIWSAAAKGSQRHW